MNILRMVYEWPPPWGGLTPGPYEMTVAQAAQGHQIRYLCGGWPKRPVFDGGTAVQVRRLPSALPKLSLFLSTAPLALAWVARWAKWADVIHGHQHLPVWYHLVRHGGWRNKPYVLHLHVTAKGRALNTHTPLDFWTRRFEWPLHEQSDRWGCANASAIICVSDSVRDEAIQHYHTDPAKITVVSNGVNTDRFQPQGQHLRAKFGFTAQDKVIILVGVLTERKRPSLLLRALQHLPNHWKALIVGQGPLQTQLETLTQELGLTERVHITGFVPYPELPALYRTANMFALLARYEGFPKVVLEALASGLPVVTTRSFVVDEQLLPFVTLLDEATPEAIAEALQASQTIQVDTQLMQAHYSWQTKVRQIENVYEQIR